MNNHKEKAKKPNTPPQKSSAQTPEHTPVPPNKSETTTPQEKKLGKKTK